MALHTDIPTRSELGRLLARRDPACVSIYLPTTPLTQDAQADRIELKNLVGDHKLPGKIDEQSGAVTFADTDDAASYGVVDEIARRVLLTTAACSPCAVPTSPAAGRSRRSCATPSDHGSMSR